RHSTGRSRRRLTRRSREVEATMPGDYEVPAAPSVESGAGCGQSGIATVSVGAGGLLRGRRAGGPTRGGPTRGGATAGGTVRGSAGRGLVSGGGLTRLLLRPVRGPGVLPGPGIGTVEARPLEHHAHRRKELPERFLAAFGAGGQRIVRERLINVEPVRALCTRIRVGRHRILRLNRSELSSRRSTHL